MHDMLLKKLLLTTILLFAFTTGIQQANATSKCHSVNGKADSTCTPGSTNPNVTQSNIKTTICTSGYTTKIRPAVTYTEKLKKQQIKDYGYSDTKLGDYEEDHLIPLEIGGSPSDPKNLWPEPHNVSDGVGSYSKDKLENSLRTNVCKGKITLQAAQKQILGSWDSAIIAQVKSTSTKKTTPTAKPYPTPTTKPVIKSNVVSTSTSTTQNNGATALCNDGTYSYAATHKGDCSKHQGVKTFYK